MRQGENKLGPNTRCLPPMPGLPLQASENKQPHSRAEMAAEMSKEIRGGALFLTRDREWLFLALSNFSWEFLKPPFFFCFRHFAKQLTTVLGTGNVMDSLCAKSWEMVFLLSSVPSNSFSASCLLAVSIRSAEEEEMGLLGLNS